MTTKKNSTSEKEEKRGRVNVGQLQRNLETPTDLTVSEQRQIKGGTKQKKPRESQPFENAVRDNQVTFDELATLHEL